MRMLVHRKIVGLFTKHPLSIILDAAVLSNVNKLFGNRES